MLWVCYAIIWIINAMGLNFRIHGTLFLMERASVNCSRPAANSTLLENRSWCGSTQTTPVTVATFHVDLFDRPSAAMKRCRWNLCDWRKSTNSVLRGLTFGRTRCRAALKKNPVWGSQLISEHSLWRAVADGTRHLWCYTYRIRGHLTLNTHLELPYTSRGSYVLFRFIKQKLGRFGNLDSHRYGTSL